MAIFAFFVPRSMVLGIAHTVLPTLSSTTPIFPFEQGFTALQTIAAQRLTTTKADCGWASFFGLRDHLHSWRWGRRLIVQRNGQRHGRPAQSGTSRSWRLGGGIWSCIREGQILQGGGGLFSPCGDGEGLLRGETALGTLRAESRMNGHSGR